MKPEWRNRSISDWQKVADQSLDTVEENDPPTEIDSNGTKFWKNSSGQLHRDNDKPAVEWASGSKEWWINGKWHRDNDKPAVEWSNGSKLWCVNGKFIRREDA